MSSRNETTPDAERRLKIMESTNDGFKIAEEDLRIRGPGEFLGTKQSGFPEFRIADLSRDFALLQQTRQDAVQLLNQDRGLIQHQLLRKIISLRFKNLFSLADIA